MPDDNDKNEDTSIGALLKRFGSATVVFAIVSYGAGWAFTSINECQERVATIEAKADENRAQWRELLRVNNEIRDNRVRAEVNRILIETLLFKDVVNQDNEAPREGLSSKENIFGPKPAPPQNVVKRKKPSKAELLGLLEEFSNDSIKKGNIEEESERYKQSTMQNMPQQQQQIMGD